jgi:biopolymer transport protein ExbD
MKMSLIKSTRKKSGLSVMGEMNTTPLIDVMLVLLVMLIITIPIQFHSVDLNLPTGAPPPSSVEPEIVRLDVDSNGSVFWNGELVADQPALEERMKVKAAQAVQPEIHLRPNKAVQYEKVANVMAAAQRHGLNKLGIVGGEQFAK